MALNTNGPLTYGGRPLVPDPANWNSRLWCLSEQSFAQMGSFVPSEPCLAPILALIRELALLDQVREQLELLRREPGALEHFMALTSLSQERSNSLAKF
jgi:hypothetical protein